ncbi:site-specific integrase [Gordonia sp. HY285]|uniref:tyrosine-type recombinase/integrase n=1 Tax=Gordonia liuliyuniae TaxID=2911517 RepID=UPI001F3A99A4|nr:site-specific integrase [Gordonia liuliyuniae]MCF8611849.1 site-specific integrase [Gordonia liuliyuniae]
MAKRRFGNVRQLKHGSGRWQARYLGPDMREHRGPRTWKSEDDAIGWLRSEERLIELDMWRAPEEREGAEQARAMSVAEYSARWIEQRSLKPSTRSQYSSYHRNHIADSRLGAMLVGTVELADVRGWYAELQANLPSMSDGTTRNARVYAYLRTVLASAVDDKLLVENPCRIRGAGATKRQRAIDVPTPAEVTRLSAAMPERLALLPLIAAWCALRRGELLGLRRCDIASDGSTITVRQAVTFVDREAVVGSPKNDRQRTVTVPPHIRELITEHVRVHASPGRQGLLFARRPGGSDVLTDGQLRHYWESARKAVGVEHLRIHGLRHAGSVWAASAGATVPELQQRLGHESSAAALRYMHAANGADAAIADRLSAIAEGL